MAAYKVNDLVIARREISEVFVDGEVLLHAKAGNVGHVVAVEQGGWPTIQWESSVTDCTEDDISPLPATTISPPVRAHA
jgi:hypothetical protein